MDRSGMRSGREQRTWPNAPVSPTGMIEFALGRTCSISGREMSMSWALVSVTRMVSAPSARTTPTMTCPLFVATEYEVYSGAIEALGARDGAVDFGAAFFADVSQVGADLTPLPLECVALRATGLFAVEQNLATARVAAGEVGDGQGQPPGKPEPVPMAGSFGRLQSLIGLSITRHGMMRSDANGCLFAAVWHVIHRNSGSPCDWTVQHGAVVLAGWHWPGAARPGHHRGLPPRSAGSIRCAR